MLIDAGAAGVRAWWLRGGGQGMPDRTAEALSLVIDHQAADHQAMVGDTVNSCPEGTLIPMQ